MRAVIISGGKITDYAYIKEQIGLFNADIIICADSGYNHAVKMGLRADLVVGDFDSSEIPDGVETARYPSEKNHTDSEIALSHARERGARELLFIGATGTRADHTLTNIFMLKSCLEQGEKAQVLDEHNRIRIVESKLSFKGDKGGFVSLVPLCDCFGVTTEGLKYPLKDAGLKFGEGVGVSNIMEGNEATVSLEKGILLVIEARD